MAAYNLATYVEETIQSVLSQTYRDFEFIIVDNGSTDTTGEILRDYKDSRIRVLTEKCNLGPSLAVNRAIENSQGKYVALLAADDLWMPDKLARQVAYLNDNPDTGAVFSIVQLIDERGQPFSDSSHSYFSVFEQPNRTRIEWLRHFFLYGNCLCAVSSLVRRSAVNGEWYRPEMLQLSDFELWLRIVLDSEIHVIQDQLTKFRIRANEANTSGLRIDATMRCAFEAATKIAPLFIHPYILDSAHLIFPEIGSQIQNQNLILKKWHLAKLFTDNLSESWRWFGLTLQSELLSDTVSRNELLNSIGPQAFAQHFGSVGISSPIGHPACRAQIYWPLNGVFVESLSLAQSFEFGIPTPIAFSIPLALGESVFRFDPCDGAALVCIEKIVVFSEMDSEQPFFLDHTNLLSYTGCTQLTPDSLRFATFWDPSLIFRLPNELSGQQLRVVFHLQLSHSTKVFRSYIDNLLNERDALNSSIEQFKRKSWLARAFHDFPVQTTGVG